MKAAELRIEMKDFSNLFSIKKTDYENSITFIAIKSINKKYLPATITDIRLDSESIQKLITDLQQIV